MVSTKDRWMTDELATVLFVEDDKADVTAVGRSFEALKIVHPVIWARGANQKLRRTMVFVTTASEV